MVSSSPSWEKTSRNIARLSFVIWLGFTAEPKDTRITPCKRLVGCVSTQCILLTFQTTIIFVNLSCLLHDHLQILRQRFSRRTVNSSNLDDVGWGHLHMINKKIRIKNVKKVRIALPHSQPPVKVGDMVGED